MLSRESQGNVSYRHRLRYPHLPSPSTDCSPGQASFPRWPPSSSAQTRARCTVLNTACVCWRCETRLAAIRMAGLEQSARVPACCCKARRRAARRARSAHGKLFVQCSASLDSSALMSCCCPRQVVEVLQVFFENDEDAATFTSHKSSSSSSFFLHCKDSALSEELFVASVFVLPFLSSSLLRRHLPLLLVVSHYSSVFARLFRLCAMPSWQAPRDNNPRSALTCKSPYY